ncbi:hypothetical protein SSTU70S_01447 [Stutzerimonas stutzeri]
MRQIDGLLVGQIEQAAGAGDEHVETLGHGLDLRVHADATEDHRTFQRQIAGVDLEAVMDLGGEFAGRCQHQHARLFRAVAVLTVRVATGEQQFEYRQGEAAGLAGTGLGGNHQVAALQHGGNSPLLHGSRLGITGGLDGTG